MADRMACIAVVGCGGFARSRLYPSVRLAGNIRLVGVCDLVEERAAQAAKAFGADAYYTDMDAMLDATRPDGVCVIGPGPMQYELGKRVLERGLNLYTEKPCANSSADAEDLAQTARSRGLIAACAFMKRHSAIFRAMRAVSRRPEFGPIRMVEVRFTQGPYQAIWGIASPMRAMLVGQMVHIFDLTRYLAGDVASVAAKLYETTPGGEYGSFAVMLTFTDGAIGVMNLNALESDTWHFNEYVRLSGFQHWVDAEDMLHLRYHPLKGWTEQADLKNQVLTWQPALDLETEMIQRAGYVGEIRDFADCCLTGRQPVATSQDCAEALKIGEAVWASAKAGGREVRVGTAPADL